MACHYPLRGWRSRVVSTKTGKRSIVFNIRDGLADQEVLLGCGQCLGCRLERSRQWAVRCIHEAMLYDDNCFVTLTYNDENLPLSGSVDIRHWQRFIKKLRKKFGAGIRYLVCGEYGSKHNRAHYHCILFNFDFQDRKFLKMKQGHAYYTSELCQKFWEDKGFCIVADVTFESAAYVARYITKKLLGKRAVEYEQVGVSPPFLSMSRRPGIGDSYYKKYKHEIWRDDYIVINGLKYRVPKFYDNRLSLEDPDALAVLKINRHLEHLKRFNIIEESSARLHVKEQVLKRRADRLLRPDC